MSLFTEGKLFNIANAESGGGSGDQHNLGWYATQAALEEAHPTATAGDWAIVGSTDTVWIWDTDTSAWTDSGAKSPTYTAGTGISITNNEISATDPVLVNKSNEEGAIAIGDNTAAGKDTVAIGNAAYNFRGKNSVAIGYNAGGVGNYAIAIGNNAHAATHSILLSCCDSLIVQNNDANTFKIANQNGNFEIMSADGTIPTARLTKVATTITLTAAGWSNGSQTVSVSGITSTGVVFVSPDPTDQADYTTAGILCTAQATDSLTFTADTTPTNDIDVVVVML